METCPHYAQKKRQNKAGKNQSGSPRYHCMYCDRKYTPKPQPYGYSEKVRQQALQMYVDGMNLRRIGRQLGGIHHTTITLWVKAHAEKLPDAPVPKKVETAEMDELFIFIGHKKTEST